MITSTIALFILSLSSAEATSFHIRPFSQFTQNAPNMVHGTIRNIRIENGVTEEGGKTIYTFADLEVKEAIKGNIQPQSVVTIRTIGGTKDGITLNLPSSVEFKEKEETVVFLSAETIDHSYEVIGMELGKFNLKEENGEQILVGGIFNFSKVEPELAVSNVPADDLSENQRPWSIKQLRELIYTQTNGNPTPSAPIVLPTNTAANILAPTSSVVPAALELNETTNASGSSFQNNYKYVGLFLILALVLYFFFRRK